jgi:hypothetical protein
MLRATCAWQLKSILIRRKTSENIRETTGTIRPRSIAILQTRTSWEGLQKVEIFKWYDYFE